MTPDEFKDIAPYEDREFLEKLSDLTKEPGFEHAVRFIMPNVDFDQFCQQLKSVKSTDEFQMLVMYPFLRKIAESTTSGITISGMENYDKHLSYTIITNHRDIVLDASFLNMVLVDNGLPTTEIAIGDNLLIYDWINDLVRVNKSFIVRRNLGVKEALVAARQLSAYIHFCISTKHDSVWIAQREGRAKDSNDKTQESLIKMLALAGGDSARANIEAVNLLPCAISYEYDPNDYLKAREFLLRRRNPDFKKTQRDDLFSMETGLLGFKGHVHYTLGRCITPQIAGMPAEADRNAVAAEAARLIDHEIHSGYMIYPINYIAYDHINNSTEFAKHYTPEQVQQVSEYINSQLRKVDVADITPEEYDFMLDAVYNMYANPLKNKLVALETEV
ncbi:MAG: acyltransferase [Muribaculaceae bacterium]|nr:acyltransferase [Muribaculaceae bacterium]